jgi:hypothetical protein
MKTIIQIILVFSIAFVFIACEDDSLPDCVQGRVIGHLHCFNVNVVQVLSHNGIGKTTDWKGETYDNIVQIPGGRIPIGMIFFRYRLYNEEKDGDPANLICNANIAPLPVPKIVITENLEENCP